MNKKNSFKLIFFCILAILVGVSLVPKTLQSDVFFTIALGNDIFENGLNSEETLTYHQGFKFYNVRWLFDVIVAFIYNYFNFLGIYIFTIILVGLINLFLYLICYKYSKHHLISLLIVFLVSIKLSAYYTARAQLISLLVFILQFYAAHELLKTNKKRYYVVLLILPIVLVNFHASVFPTFFLFYLPFIAEYFIGKSAKAVTLFKRVEFNNYKYYKNLCVIVLINLLEGCLSPLGLVPYTLMFQTTFNFSSKMISEMQTANVIDAVALVLYPCILLTNRDKIKANHFFMIIGLLILSILVKRSSMYYFVIGGMISAQLLRDGVYDEMLRVNPSYKKAISYIYKIIILIIILFSFYNLYININRQYIHHQPEGPAKYLKEEINLVDYNLYNGFDTGAFLEFCGIKPFMDSRAEVYEKPFNDTTILEDFYNLEYEEFNYEQFFEKYDINLALFEKNKRIYKKVLKGNKDSRLEKLYEDNNYVIYKYNEQ